MSNTTTTTNPTVGTTQTQSTDGGQTLTTTPVSTVKAEKKSKITDTIVSILQQLPDGQLMTISEISQRMPHVKRQTLQATLSQMVGKRVVKVATGLRQPGYKAMGK